MEQAKKQAETLRRVASEIEAADQGSRSMRQALVEVAVHDGYASAQIHCVDTVLHNERMRYADFDAQKVARASAGRQLADYFAQRMEWEGVDAMPGDRHLRYYDDQMRFRASVIAMSPAEFRRVLREVAERAAGLR